MRVVAAGLMVFVVWQAGWSDRVTLPDGSVRHGRVQSIEGNEVVLVEESGETRLTVKDSGAVRYGLRRPAETLLRRPGWFLLGVVLQLVGVVITFIRWGWLLDGAGLGIRRGLVVRLGWVGQFFGAILPGGAGMGDIVKALYVARHHDTAKARAVLTVLVDRMIGLFVLTSIALLAAFGAPSGSRLAAARPVMAVVLLIFASGCLIMFHRKLARSLLKRLPFAAAAEIREGISLYAGRPRELGRAAGISIVSQGLTLLAFVFYGLALGEPLGFLAALVAVPIALMVGAIPGLPGGWGVGDAAFFYFLPAAGVDPAQALALSFSFRGVQTILALPGGLWITGSR